MNYKIKTICSFKNQLRFRIRNAFVVITLVSIFSSCVTEQKIVLKNFISEKPKILVCPVHILFNNQSSYDTISAERIISYINDKKYGKARLSEFIPPANNEWKTNEARMLTNSINLFIVFVKDNRLPDDTYILYPEFLKRGKSPNVVAVHYCLLNNKGEIAMRGLLNSHWNEFKEVNPKTNDDCYTVFINGFEQKIR